MSEGEAMEPTYEPVDVEMARSLLGEGIHTGLRKGTDAPGAHDLWVAIHDSTEAWSEAIDFAIWGLVSMGYELCKREEKDDRVHD